MILQVFQKTSRQTLRSGEAILHKNVSRDTIKIRLLAHEVKLRNTIKKPTAIGLSSGACTFGTASQNRELALVNRKFKLC